MAQLQQLTALALVIAIATGVIVTPTAGGGIANDPTRAAAVTDDTDPIASGTADIVGFADLERTSGDWPAVRSDALVRAVESLEPVVPGVLIPPAGYSRYDDSDPLENAVRRSVFETVERSPGTYLSQIAEEVGYSLSSVRHHVRVLVDERQLTTEKIDGKRRVFPRSVDDLELHVELNDPSRRVVIESVERLEPTTVSRLSVELDRSPSTVSYHLSRLEAVGLVLRDRDGQSVSVTLTEKAHDGLNRLRAAG